MKNKNQTNINLLGIAALIVALSIGYYFVIYLPRVDKLKTETEKQNTEQVNKARCQKDASDFYREKQSKEKEIAGYNVLGIPSYAYNPELKTCLISWEDMQSAMGSGVATHVRFITDVYSNNDVYSWWQSYDGAGKLEDILGSEKEYKQKIQHYGL